MIEIGIDSFAAATIDPDTDLFSYQSNDMTQLLERI